LIRVLAGFEVGVCKTYPKKQTVKVFRDEVLTTKIIS